MLAMDPRPFVGVIRGYFRSIADFCLLWGCVAFAPITYQGLSMINILRHLRLVNLVVIEAVVLVRSIRALLLECALIGAIVLMYSLIL